MQMQKDLVVAGQRHREEDKQSQAGMGGRAGWREGSQKENFQGGRSSKETRGRDLTVTRTSHFHQLQSAQNQAKRVIRGALPQPWEQGACLARSAARDHHPSRPLAHGSETHILDQMETPTT